MNPLLAAEPDMFGGPTANQFCSCRTGDEHAQPMAVGIGGDEGVAEIHLHGLLQDRQARSSNRDVAVTAAVSSTPIPTAIAARVRPGAA